MITITTKEAGQMIDYLDRRKTELEKKINELHAELSINRQMRDNYQQLWLSLEKDLKRESK